VTRIRAVFLALSCVASSQAPAAAPNPVLPDRAELGAIPAHSLRAEAVAAALARADRSTRPLRFAAPVAVRLPLAAGLWDAPRAGVARWRLRVHSAGALSLSVRLAPLLLPAGAQLWIYDPRGDTVHGPYGATHVKTSGFWSPLVAGDQLVLELTVPAAAAAQTRLEVAEAFHGYEAFGKAGVPGSSGGCNIDAACEAQDWGAEARSVAHITIGNEFLCSGQLVNNVQQDQTPFFLTAWHCGIEHGSGTDDSVNFYFNYQAACGGTAAPPSNPITGATLLADDEVADFALLRMDDAPPTNAYFAGWDATGDGGASGASIHHPSGDSKKISLFDAPVTAADVDIGGECLVEAWEVHWVSGTTEQGSSGGGLWNSARQLIGVLSGGTASCTSLAGADYYGRLDRAWTANEARSGQLKAHLDPSGTCIAAIPGLDPQVVAKPSPITSGPQRCEGEATACRTGNGSGFLSGGSGGSPGALPLVLLAGALARRRLRAAPR
jgi:lysyl endopeptidase